MSLDECERLMRAPLDAGEHERAIIGYSLAKGSTRPLNEVTIAGNKS